MSYPQIPHHHILYTPSTQTVLSEPCELKDCDKATRRWILDLSDLKDIQFNCFQVDYSSSSTLHDYFGPF